MYHTKDTKHLVINAKSRTFETPELQRLVCLLDELAGLHAEHLQIYLCPSMLDLKEAASAPRTHLKIFSQEASCRSGTGHTSVSSLVQMQVDGVLVNHPENPQSDHAFVRELCQGQDILETCLIVTSLKDQRLFHDAPARMIALEPQHLIGGASTVVDEDPELVAAFVRDATERGQVCLLGGGFKSIEQCLKALDHGAQGWLISGFLMCDLMIERITSLVGALR